MVTSMKPVVFSRWRVMGPVVRSCMATEDGGKAGRPLRGPRGSGEAGAYAAQGRFPRRSFVVSGTQTTGAPHNGGHVELDTYMLEEREQCSRQRHSASRWQSWDC